MSQIVIGTVKVAKQVELDAVIRIVIPARKCLPLNMRLPVA